MGPRSAGRRRVRGGLHRRAGGCTANFIFASGSTRYVGTGRHCVNAIGEEVTMQVDPTTLAVVGTVSHMTSGEGVPGNDWALIRIDPAVAQKWGVTPAVPLTLGPSGVYSGCDIGTPVLHYGHGYGVAVGPGKVEGGVRPTGTTTASAGRASARRATPGPPC